MTIGLNRTLDRNIGEGFVGDPFLLGRLAKRCEHTLETYVKTNMANFNF